MPQWQLMKRIFAHPASYAVFCATVVLPYVSVQSSELPMRFMVPQKQDVYNPVQKGTILMRKETPYSPPMPEEPVEDMVKRITSEAIAASEARQTAQTAAQIAAVRQDLESFGDKRMQQMAQEIRSFSEKNTMATAAELRQFTEDQARQVAQDLRQYAEKNTQMSAAELRQFAIAAAHRVSKETVVEADPQVMDAIRKVVHLAMVEQDEPVRYTVDRLVEQRLARAAEDPVEAAVLKMTEPVLQKAEDRVNTQTAAQLNDMRQKTEDMLALYRATLSQQIAERDKDLQTSIYENQLKNISTISDIRYNSAQKIAQLEKDTLQRLAQEGALRESQISGIKYDSAQKIAQLEKDTFQRLAQEESARESQIAQLSQKTAQQLAAEKGARAAELAELRRVTDMRLASLEDETRQYIQKVTADSAARVSSNLMAYAHNELESLNEQLTDAIDSSARQSALTAEEIRQHAASRLDKLKELTELRIQEVAQQKANEVEDRLVAYAADKAYLEAERVKLTEEDIAQVAQKTLDEAGDEIRALAMQTLADSGDYIKTVAREAIIEEDPAMQAALNTAARKVITDGNDKVTFAIRQAVEEVVSNMDLQKAQPLPEPTIVTGEEIKAAGLAIGELTPPEEYASHVELSGAQRLSAPRHRVDWVDIRQYQVVIHEDNKTLEQLLASVLSRAESFTGPWQVKWKISRKNEDILNEKFSLDVETSFENFVAYLAQYMVNYRGVQLTFSLFDTERMIVVSD